jgi:probable phosphoglycerate mutase
MGDLILLRHGETEWSLAGKHTGRTDIPLTPDGEAAAKALAPMLSRRDIVAVFTSPTPSPNPTCGNGTTAGTRG